MAQTQLYTRLGQIHVRPESTVDTYLAPADGTTAFLAEIGDAIATPEGDNYTATEHRGDYLATDETPGPLVWTIPFRVRIKGSGSLGVAPEFREVLLGCGMRESISAGASVTYYPYSIFDGATAAGPPATANPAQSYSLTVFEGKGLGVSGGIRYGIKGSFGNLRITAGVGAAEPGFLECEFRGSPITVSDQASLSASLAYDTTVAPAFLGASASVNFGSPYTPKGLVAFNFDLGNQITIGRDMSEAFGIYGARIVGRKSSGSFDPEMVPVATHDWYGIQRAGTAGTFTTGTIGGTAGNRWAFSIARIFLRPPSPQNREGIRALSIPFGCSSLATHTEAANPAVSLVFT